MAAVVHGAGRAVAGNTLALAGPAHARGLLGRGRLHGAVGLLVVSYGEIQDKDPGRREFVFRDCVQPQLLAKPGDVWRIPQPFDVGALCELFRNRDHGAEPVATRGDQRLALDLQTPRSASANIVAVVLPHSTGPAKTRQRDLTGE